MTLWTVHHDLRAPEFGTPADGLYRAALEISQWADEQGAGGIVLSEHHGSADGFLPAPLTMAAAIAARTRHVTITVSALILTLRDPIATAEDAIVVDIVSGGRLVLVLAPGYVPGECEMFDIEFHRRGEIFEEKTAAFLRALSGEKFEYRGRTVHVTPQPFQRPRPVVMMGGAAPKRAARLADGYVPATGDRALADAYLAERRRLGKPAGILGRSGGPQWVFVTDDPDRTWAQLAPHVLHEANAYGAWSAAVPGASPFAVFENVDQVRRSGLFAVVTPGECIELARGDTQPATLVFKPLVAGLDPEIGWESMQLFVDRVLPEICKEN